MTYNDENSIACAISLAYYSARKEYKMIRELPSGRGYADIVFLPLPHTGKPALVVELKYDKTVSAAIQQIKDRNYILRFAGKLGEKKRYTGKVLAVGISYNKKTKEHNCEIEAL